METAFRADHAGSDHGRHEVAAFIRAHRDSLLVEAAAKLESAPPVHYRRAGAEAIEARLSALLDIVISGCTTRQLDKAISYATQLARTRQGDGFELAEVQSAVNALEEAVWRSISAEMSATHQAEALALAATVFGAIKDRIGTEFVAGATTGRRPPVDVGKLFDGTEANLGTGDL
jgi:hypothetical protein